MPPVSGNYRFRGYAENLFAVYLSDATYGSTTPVTTTLISSNQDQPVAIYPNYY